MRRLTSLFHYLLIAIEIFVGVTAISGGVQLLSPEHMGVPVTVLSATPFRDFTIPAMILIIIIGGLHLLAAVLVFRKNRFALEVAATAGYGLLIWLVTELFLLKEHHWLQVLYLTAAFGTLILVMLLLKYGKGSDAKK